MRYFQPVCLAALSISAVAVPASVASTASSLEARGDPSGNGCQCNQPYEIVNQGEVIQAYKDYKHGHDGVVSIAPSDGKDPKCTQVRCVKGTGVSGCKNPDNGNTAQAVTNGELGDQIKSCYEQCGAGVNSFQIYRDQFNILVQGGCTN